MENLLGYMVRRCGQMQPQAKKEASSQITHSASDYSLFYPAPPRSHGDPSYLPLPPLNQTMFSGASLISSLTHQRTANET